MSNNYLQQTSTLSPILSAVVPDAKQQQNQFSSILTDITNLFHAVNGLLGNKSTGVSWFQNQNVVTSTRAIGTIYNNSSGLTMMVTITFNITAGGSVIIYSDSTLNPSTQVGSTNIAATLASITFMVLSNNHYTVTKSGTVALVTWTEWS